VTLRSAGVDRVTFLSDIENFALLAFAQAADSQSWTPWYPLSSNDYPAVTQSSFPSDQLPRMTGIGNIPDNDVSASVLASP
jgi:hypothetical protein